MKRNEIDLTEELRKQGWENYFQRLYGPIYTYLVKELWRIAYSDDHYIVSHVLRVKMVITEKSIANLLNMEKTGGRRIYNINPRAKYMSQEIIPTIFKQNIERNSSKNKLESKSLAEDHSGNYSSSPSIELAHALSAQNKPEPKTNIPSPSEQPPTPPSEPHIETPTENPITHQSKPLTENIPTPLAPTSPTSEPEPTFTTLEEAVALFAESSVEKIRSLSKNSRISDDPSAVRIHWNRVIRWMTYEAFKLKSLSEQVRNDFIREAGERLQDRLVREAEERARREAEEKARLEEKEIAREATEKAIAEAAAAAEAEAKAKPDAEEAAHIAVEEAAEANFDFAPLVLKTLEELQKEQHIMQARLDQQDSVNSNIQNPLTQLLQRMPPPLNP
ncbi:eukaryotic translation initiation factor 4 gamma-like [Lathyrus oleraceus]|uniref:eukaryotic translation initiation factor 4 gamma-like n=1 Tax=Pisum sativum TaxID=3888 RepID=UPI0021D188DC|nr:eukaryotic translation initiation factor 4 gamma-like [Pisum sativum]